ncbi:hypothetical protein CAL7716_085000 [Calothrix sp. PCC 7716]|nr:hypothetical protein CAL7716_085000 [Calothrix sp. PCC 7716]
MDKIYLLYGKFECEGGYIFGAYSTQGAAEEALAQIKKDKRIFCDKFYIEQLTLDKSCLLMI